MVGKSFNASVVVAVDFGKIGVQMGKAKTIDVFFHRRIDEKMVKHLRVAVETVGSQLTERFQISKIKVKDLWHYQNRILRKIMSHTVAVFLNLQIGNKPLQLALLSDI